MRKIKYLPLNWPNGLKLTGEHFIHTHCQLVESMQFIRSEQLRSDNYGIGEPLQGESESLSIELKGSNIDGAVIELKTCNALTRNGIPIVYSRALYGDYVPRIELRDIQGIDDDQSFYVLLSSLPYNHHPVGVPNVEVIPLHHPFLLPEIQIQLFPLSESSPFFLSDESLIAGILRIKSGVVSLERNYIPPVQRIAYHHMLTRLRERVANGIRDLYASTMTIFRKNVSDGRRSLLVDNTFSLCQVLQDFHDSYLYEIDNLIEELPPHALIYRATILANKLSTALRTLPHKSYESLLQYYYEWTDITPSVLESTIGSVLSVQYNHADMYPAFSAVIDMLEVLEKVFRKMSELEYVGLIRENIIISDDSYQEQEKTRKSFRFLD